MKSYVLFIFFIFSVTYIMATTINIPGDYATIQEGIDASENGDEIIVAPGIYVENIDFDGKAITLGSWFYTTQDTSYISQTIIDGGHHNAVIRFTNEEDSSSLLTGFTITNGSAFYGGGIYCGHASPVLTNLIITNNYSSYLGGGICCRYADIVLSDCVLTNNSADDGAGIYIYYSSADLNNITIESNTALYKGGGIFCFYSIPDLENVTITNNSAGIVGGGIYCFVSSPEFNSINRCNIYANNAQNHGYGCDIYTDSMIDLIVDTFTVMNPTDLQAAPWGYYNFDILQGILDQVNADLYVSPEGDNTNNGLNAENPLQTILYACSIISADSLNPHTIHLADGIYSPSINEEFFPVYIPSNVSLVGASETNVTLDAENTAIVIYLIDAVNISISALTVTHGNCSGIYCQNSSPNISNVTITNNSSSYRGGGIYCNESSPNLTNLTIMNNTSDYGGGMSCTNSSPNLYNVTLTDNEAEYGGGLYCNESSPNLTNVTIMNNLAYQGGGIFCWEYSSPIIEHVTINNNVAEIKGGGVYCNYSSPIFEDVMIMNNSSGETGGGIYFWNSSPNLANVTIVNNSVAEQGGGIYCLLSVPVFSSNNRCNIYANNVQNRGNGSDIYSLSDLQVIVDTFTVISPTDFHAAPLENFSFDILHGFQNQINADLYVSPQGDNDNSGLIAEQPFQTIQHACSRILADSMNPHTIYLAEGTYSLSNNSEFFPVCIPSYVSLEGAAESDVILDADGIARVIRLENAVNVMLSNLTVTNGYHKSSGGGIYCKNSSMSLVNVTITNNSAMHGGGFSSYHCDPSFTNVTIANNSAVNDGGGINLFDSNLDFENVTITNNSAGSYGGGIYCYESNPDFDNVFIVNNSAEYSGGGIYCSSSSPSFTDVTIKHNLAGTCGGGIYSDYDSNPVFSSANRCNIYLNNALDRGTGNDFCSVSPVNVIVDTFTVLIPTDFHVSPLENFNFDILHGFMEQVNADLYVSPQGDNANSGLNAENPLQTIRSACTRILADCLNPLTIYLAEGIYSPSTNGEFFPVDIPANVSLAGDNEANVILDAESSARVITIAQAENVMVSNLTVTNGYANAGGGISCLDCSPCIKNVTITNNSAYYAGGGIYCNASSTTFMNVTITNNSAVEYGGGVLCDAASPILVNCILWNDYPQEIELIDYSGPSSITIAYSDIYGGQSEIGHEGYCQINWLEGNIIAEPLFVNAEMGHFWLAANSPCIDAGIAYYEYEGEVLIDLEENEYYGIAPDMGGYEYGLVVNEMDEIEPTKNGVTIYPNPFNPETNILFALSADSNVLLEIYNIKGQKVTNLVNGFYEAGSHQVTWKAENLGSGIYLLRFNTNEQSEMKKLILLK